MEKEVTFQDKLRFYRDECSGEISLEILNGDMPLDDERRLLKLEETAHYTAPNKETMVALLYVY